MKNFPVSAALCREGMSLGDDDVVVTIRCVISASHSLSQTHVPSGTLGFDYQSEGH